MADLGDAGIAWRADIEGAKLADRVAVADDQLAGLARVFFILRDGTERVELENPVVPPNTGVPFDDAVRAYRRG